MNLKAYLDLYALLQHDDSNRSERRTFGLAHPELKEKPAAQLMSWVEEKRITLKKPLLSETLEFLPLWRDPYVNHLWLLYLGLLSGVGLLTLQWA